MSDSERTRFKPRAKPAPIRRLQVVVVDGPGKGTVHEPDGEGPISVGASTDNQIVLADPTVSRYHLELAQLPEGIQVSDLGSRNGTFVSDVRLERAVVRPGTRLTLGGSMLELAEGTPIEPTDPGADVELPGLVSSSAAMADVARQVQRLASSDVSVLLEGETGVGKDVVAQAIHQLSSRRDAPMVVVDCGSLPATLIASELFGHERGAFTGAEQQRIGAFETADGGTLFLDEIGELPLQLQPALLGALERRRFRRLGGAQEVAIDVRVLAATNRDLRSEANAGTFRPDLYFRLAVARVRIPALRERPEDIEPLVQHFVREQQGSVEESPFGAAALDALRRQRWSGNVRELRNVVEAALAIGRIQLDPTRARTRAGETPASDLDGPIPPYRDARAEALSHFEHQYLTRLIARAEGNASLAARLATMDRPYLLTLLRRHGLR